MLVRTMKVLALIGLAFMAFPFLSLLFSGSDQGQNGRPSDALTVDLTDLAPGEIRKVQWRGRPVWIYRRTASDLAGIQELDRELRDPHSASSEQPVDARNAFRSLRREYFVFIPLETSRNCRVRPAGPEEYISTEQVRWRGGFVEACHLARFDPAGRVYRDFGIPQQRNLSVPPHRFLSETRVQIGP